MISRMLAWDAQLRKRKNSVASEVWEMLGTLFPLQPCPAHSHLKGSENMK
jgi:hypothetical protein